MARKTTAASQRSRRLSDLIQRELSTLFLEAKSHTREPGLTITAVEVTRDLSVATIWVTQLDGDSKKIEQDLNHAAAYWRKALAPALSALHKIPALRFRYDISLEQSLHINTLISQAMARTAQSENASENEASEPVAETSGSTENSEPSPTHG